MKTLAVFVILGLFVFLAQGAPYSDEDNHQESSEEPHSDLDHKSEESESEEGHHPRHHGGNMPPHHGGKKPHHHGGHHPHRNTTKPPHHHGGHHPHHNTTKPPHHHKEHEKDGKKDSVDENSMADSQAQKRECTDGEKCEEKHHGKEKMVRLVVPIAVGLILLLAGLGLGFLIFRKCRRSRSSKIPFEKFDEKPPVLVQNMTYGVTPSKDIPVKE